MVKLVDDTWCVFHQSNDKDLCECYIIQTNQLANLHEQYQSTSQLFN